MAVPVDPATHGAEATAGCGGVERDVALDVSVRRHEVNAPTALYAAW